MEFAHLFSDRTDRSLFPVLHFDTTQMTEESRTKMRDWIFGDFQSPVTFDTRSKRMDVQINGKSLGFVLDIRRLMLEAGGLEVANGK